MTGQVCIHGHFYQPPREDPWLGCVPPEASAAPFANWNERITRESYAPLAFARLLDDEGRIREIVNVYEHISFNVGPTLCSWLADNAPQVLARMVEADAQSLRRLGHGNALAQTCHHVIMPLASRLDKKVETAWAIADFKARFGREPEGLWLSETAVDTDSLEALAEAGIRFTLLAPSQARAVAPLGTNRFEDIAPEALDISRPYRVNLPSGRFIDIFFYHGALSQAVAFERLLASGDAFYGRLAGAAGGGLLLLATDGETYGHHFTFGEMALAYALDRIRRGDGGLSLTNPAAFLAANPPAFEVRLHEPSAWSCSHGVDRWRTADACGARPGWQTEWRGPLRQALSAFKEHVDKHFLLLGGTLFTNPEAALVDYGEVVSGLTPSGDFAARHLRPKVSAKGHDIAFSLLCMQERALASLASCAWFFDDLGRLEPQAALTNALRALDLARQTGAEDFTPAFEAILAKAWSNDPAMGSGADILRKVAAPRRETPASLAALSYDCLEAEGRLEAGRTVTKSWPAVDVSFQPSAQAASRGALVITPRHASAGTGYSYEVSPSLAPLHPSRHLHLQSEGAPGRTDIQAFSDLAANKRLFIAEAFIRTTDERGFEDDLERASVLGPLLPPWQEAQKTVIRAPSVSRLAQALAWNHVWGLLELTPEAEKILLLFLRHELSGSAAGEAASARISEQAAVLAAAPKPDWDTLARMMARCAAIGLRPDVWAAQNVLWQRLPQTTPEVRAAFGFTRQ